MNENHSKDFVLRRIEEGFSLGGHEYPGYYWAVVLTAILAVGLIYVVWMYVRDGGTIGWFWGSFLALLRLSVYGVIAAVFLLPAYQNWDVSKQTSKVVVAMDVSGSMGSKDDVPDEAHPWEKLPTRQDKVVAFLADPGAKGDFFKRLEENNPVSVYPFGRGVDEDAALVLQDGLAWDRKAYDQNQTDKDHPEKQAPGQSFTREYLREWLNPNLTGDAPGGDDQDIKAFKEKQDKRRRLRQGTNVGESALSVLGREINNMPQGVVVISDFRSTEGGPQAFKELAERARRAKVPLFAVVVGEDRPRTSIDIADARGPDVARPNDPFPIGVDLIGEGIPEDRETTLYLDVYKPLSKDVPAKPGKDAPFKVLEKKITFKGRPLPRAQVEFPISPADFGEAPSDKPPETKPDKPGDKPADKDEPKSNKPELAEGDWLFVPRVPKDPSEIFPDKEHTREPVVVKVIKRPLRVMLFASAPTRDYQFIRTMMVREFDKKRIELSIFIQPLPGQAAREGVVQDVPKERLLNRFPDRFNDNKQEADQLYNLANYDVILAFDPDWTQLSREQTEMVQRWVEQQGGGLVVVAGPIHTVELAKPGAAAGAKGSAADRAKLKPILDIYPVILKDVRLENERNTAIPAALNFVGASPDMEFLKLDEENEKGGLIDAWKEFFYGKEAAVPPRIVRGVYGAYPVQKAKDGATLVATFKDPANADAGTREPPYLVIGSDGRGRVVWLGSGETWRLRQYREVWHERFWTKLTRYASQGSTGSTTRRIIPLVSKTTQVGRLFEVEAQMFGQDLKPLKKNSEPKIQLRLPVGVDDKDVQTTYTMEPKVSPGEWEGRFTARFLVKVPGEYGLDIKLPQSEGQQTPSSHKFNAIEVNPELENTRPDLAAAYELASEADDVMARLDDATKAQLKAALRRPTDKGSEKDKPRLVFDLKSASIIPELMQKRENTQQSRGKVEDVWDQGLPLAKILNWFALVSVVIFGLLLLLAFLYFGTGKPAVGTLIGAGLVGALALAAWLGALYVAAYNPGVSFSIILGLVVGLLCVEWLTRKLLRLA